jgi:hypothetical protein
MFACGLGTCGLAMRGVTIIVPSCSLAVTRIAQAQFEQNPLRDFQSHTPRSGDPRCFLKRVAVVVNPAVSQKTGTFCSGLIEVRLYLAARPYVKLSPAIMSGYFYAQNSNT